MQTGTTTELNLADYFKANKMEYKVVAFEKEEEVLAGHEDGLSDADTMDESGIYAQPAKLAQELDDHVVLLEIISKKPRLYRYARATMPGSTW